MGCAGLNSIPPLATRWAAGGAKSPESKYLRCFICMSIRAYGVKTYQNWFGITGWAIGVGMTTLVNPIMFNNIKIRSYFPLAGLNLIWIPTVFLFYPETRNQSLESIESFFSTSSPFFWKMEQACRLCGDVLAERAFIRRAKVSMLHSLKSSKKPLGPV